MSRSGYDDCCDGWGLIRWRGAVAAAIKGSRGRKLLADMAAALDAMACSRGERAMPTAEEFNLHPYVAEAVAAPIVGKVVRRRVKDPQQMELQTP